MMARREKIRAASDRPDPTGRMRLRPDTGQVFRRYARTHLARDTIVTRALVNAEAQIGVLLDAGKLNLASWLATHE
jgi:hypothetical protein